MVTEQHTTWRWNTTFLHKFSPNINQFCSKLAKTCRFTRFKSFIRNLKFVKNRIMYEELRDYQYQSPQLQPICILWHDAWKSAKFNARQRLGKQVPAEMNMHATIEEPISKQPIGKHTTIGVLLETVFSIRSVQRGFTERVSWELAVSNPCGGGVEYLHRDPASRRRRRKGKSQIWDSKIWS
jgi:hypothetical protein